jgi:hypothetical protein
MSGYNGWKNWETWATNLHFEETFDDEAGHMDGGLTAERAKEVVEDWIEAVATYPGGSYLSDIIGSVLGDVDWHEIAEHYKGDSDEPEADAGLDAWRDKEHENG